MRVDRYAGRPHLALANLFSFQTRYADVVDTTLVKTDSGCWQRPVSCEIGVVELL